MPIKKELPSLPLLRRCSSCAHALIYSLHVLFICAAVRPVCLILFIGSTKPAVASTVAAVWPLSLWTYRALPRLIALLRAF